MTRVQFLNDLYHHLYGMTQEQAEQHLTYYAEMLADRMEEGMSEEEAVAGMEDVETIARRILEEEGLPYTPPDQRPVAPPAYPDAAKLGGGGGTRAYQAPKRFSWRKILQISLWAVAILVIVGAVGRLFGLARWGNSSVRNYAAESTPVPESMIDDPVLEEAALDYINAPYLEDFEYTEGENYILVDDVNTIDIEWAAGVVYIQSWSGSDIQVQEYAQSELTERTRMETGLEDGVLTVRYRSGIGLGNVKGRKWLTVLVPEGLMGEIDVATASASVTVQGLETGTLRVSTISGDISEYGCYAQTSVFSSTSGTLNLEELESDRVEASTTSGDIFGYLWFDSALISSTSGDIQFTALDTTGSLEVRTVSGDIQVWANDSTLQKIAAGSTSGDISLSLPLYDLGFTLDFQTVSGRLDVPSETSTPSQKNGTYVYEDGSCEIEVETVSGNLRIY